MSKIKGTISGHWQLTVIICLLLVCSSLKGYPQVAGKEILSAEMLSSLKLAKMIPLPYGIDVISRSFSVRESVDKETAVLLTKSVDTMNAAMFADYENKQRIRLRIDTSLQRLLLKSSDSTIIEIYQGLIQFRAARLLKEKHFELYSLMASEQLDCNNCEYGFHQTVNILVTVSEGRIADHLVAAYNRGNDLSRDHRYFYLSALKKVYTVDFSADEEDTSFRDSQTWLIDNSGRFLPVKPERNKK